MQYFFLITDFLMIKLIFTHGTKLVFQGNVRRKMKITLNSKKNTVNILKYLLSLFFCAYI